MNHHHRFFDLISVVLVLLVVALLTPVLLGTEGTSGFTAAVIDAFSK